MMPTNGERIAVIETEIKTSLKLNKINIYLNQELLGPLEKGEGDNYYFIISSEKLKSQNEIKIEAQDSLGQESKAIIIVFSQ